MGKDMVSLTIEGEVRQYPAGTSFLAISQEYQEKYSHNRYKLKWLSNILSPFSVVW